MGIASLAAVEGPRYGEDVKRLCSLLPLILVLYAAPAKADPLDGITGTESWKTAGPMSRDAEWKEWYRARVAWRRSLSEFRNQQKRSHRLALLLRRFPSGPRFHQVHKIVRDRALQPAPPAAAAPGNPAGQRRPHTILPEPKDERSAKRRRKTAPQTPEPPSWVQIPVERLDNKGQALDEEGDRELKRALQKKTGK